MKKQSGLLLSLFIALGLFAGLLAGCSADPAQAEQNSGQNNSHAIPNDSFDQNKISREVVEGNMRFAFDIFRQLNQEDAQQNVFISPFSISGALTMAYQGAATTTKEAMAKTLGYSSLEDDRIKESYKNLIPYLTRLDDKVKLNIGNSVWVREGENIKQDFLTVNQDVFKASVNPLDFNRPDAADQINQWVSRATNEKIDKIINPPIAEDVILYLINAVYFKGDWAVRFESKNTFTTQFKSENGKEGRVEMMSRTGKVHYGQGEGFQAVRLPYGSGKAAMYCILPEENQPINDFIATLDAGRWQAIKDSISERDEVNLQLPRFKLEYGIKNLNDSLKALGMGIAFTDKADFSGIGDNICISRVLHKAVIEVNEEGSEAAAATATEMQLTSIANPVAFIADRPFVFLIVDDQTGTILFMGKLCEATA